MVIGQEERQTGSVYVLQHLGGWLFGTFVVLLGLFFGLAGAGALNGHATVTAHPGTFRIESCAFAGDHHECEGTFEDDVNGQTVTGVSAEMLWHGDPGEVAAFKVPDGYSDYAGDELIPSELSRALFLMGAGAFTVAVGLFCVLTGYSPRPSSTNRRPVPSYGRISIGQAWRGIGSWGPVRPTLCGLAGLGVLIAAGGAVVSLVYS
ncbi:hypothetical protein [Streptomyces sp. NPDC002790]|uniref:hypothetical protein n=1 Tax=Streptomyces sp. NPDC002790 TaxID=3154431 RepID=UPI0033214E6E